METVEGLILAAGRGERLNGQPKAFLRLGDETLIERLTRLAVKVSPSVIVAAPPEDLARTARMLGDRARVIAGGQSRGQSFRLLLEAASAPTILVLDVVHPLVTYRLCERVMEAASGSGAAVAVGRPFDQVITSDGKAAAPGQPLYLLQKPIVFRLADVRRGMAAAGETAADTADGHGVLELLDLAGVRVSLVEAEPWNFKLTTDKDWQLISALADRLADTEGLS